MALGYDPTTSPPSTFPTLDKGFNPGQSAPFYAGDMWNAARITWIGDAEDPCKIEPIPSKQPNPKKDGDKNICVDTNAQNKSAPTANDLWLFSSDGSYPKNNPVGDLCWH